MFLFPGVQELIYILGVCKPNVLLFLKQQSSDVTGAELFHKLSRVVKNLPLQPLVSKKEQIIHLGPFIILFDILRLKVKVGLLGLPVKKANCILGSFLCSVSVKE